MCIMQLKKENQQNFGPRFTYLHHRGSFFTVLQLSTLVGAADI